MNEGAETVRRDLVILKEMVAELQDYLMSEATHWTMLKGDMPKLTIGGCLMRLHRLPFVRDLLNQEENEVLEQAIGQCHHLLIEHVVRFEYRTHQELHARLSEWSSYLRNMASRIIAESNYYTRVADTRVVLEVMADKLQTTPYHLDTRVSQEVATLDQNLRERWRSGPFVWATIWQPAYPQEKFWWLYGNPK